MKRSIRSRLAEQLLWAKSGKKSFTNKEQLEQLLAERRIENAKPYVLPEAIQTKYAITKTTFHDMDCYVYNEHVTAKQILYLHGGGYVNQPFDQHWAFLGAIAAETKARIVVPIYPKAPNFDASLSFEKVLPLYEHILSETNALDVVLMGDSAGGGFALALAQLLAEKRIDQPKDIILLSPWLDVTMQNPDIDALGLDEKDPMLGVYGLQKMGEAYAGQLNTHHYFVSPINGTLTGLGRLSLFVGTHELFLADARKLKKLTEAANVPLRYFEYAQMNHVFPLYPIPEADKARAQIIDMINTPA